MANKHVEDPCILSGEPVPPNTEINYWLYPNVNTVRVLCPNCNNLVSVNKTSKKFRKHSMENPVLDPDQFNLIQSFE
jgi:hypothetical protein